MKLHPPRVIPFGATAFALAAAALVGGGAGIASASTAPTEPAEMAAGCSEITALLDSVDGFAVAYFDEDGDAVQAAVDAIPDAAAAAQEAAPPEIADAVDLAVAEIPAVLAALEGVDLSDTEAIDAALSSLPPGEDSGDSDQQVREWAADNCGWVSAMDALFAEALEPQPCEILDAAGAATAAGVDVDTTDTDGSGDVNLGVFWTKSCSYDNGAMSLSTLSFNDLDQVLDFYMDNLVDDAGNPIGEVLDVDLGSLPASTVVTRVDESVTVSVFDATVPFSVTFSGELEPAAVVAAAEAVFAGLPAEVPPPPMSSDAP